MLNGTIGAPSRFADGYIFDGKELPNATNYESEPFQFGMLQGAPELVIELGADLSVTAAKKVELELWGSDTHGGTYAKVATIYTAAGGASSATSVSKGEVARYAPNSKCPAYCKLKVVADFDASGSTVTAVTEFVAR